MPFSISCDAGMERRSVAYRGSARLWRRRRMDFLATFATTDLIRCSQAARGGDGLAGG